MIHTDTKRISTDLLHKGTTYKIRGALFAVYNALGHGHKEQVYQKALAREFKEQGIQFEQEKSISVKYKDEIVGSYRPDFIVEEKIIIELKAVEFMPKSFEEQLIHYLKTTSFQIGLLVNFGTNPIQIKRLIWTP